MKLTLEKIIEFYGNSEQAAEAARKNGEKLSARHIRCLAEQKKELSKSKQEFFAKIIKKECKAFTKLCDATLDDGGVLES